MHGMDVEEEREGEEEKEEEEDHDHLAAPQSRRTAHTLTAERLQRFRDAQPSYCCHLWATTLLLEA